MGDNSTNQDAARNLIDILRKCAEDVSIFKQNISNLQAEKKQKEEKKELLKNQITYELRFWGIDNQPYKLGHRFIIGNSWKKSTTITDPEFIGRQYIIIDPGVAFGFSHATTHMCVEALEQYWQGGRLLDVGTGAGVLAFASAYLQPNSKIETFDISQNIVDHARLNLTLNGLNESIDLRLGVITDYPAQAYDVVIANLLPDLHASIKKDLVARLKPEGILIISGFTTEAEKQGVGLFDWEATHTKGIPAKQLEKMFKKLNLKLVEHKQLRGFSALIFQLK